MALQSLLFSKRQVLDLRSINHSVKDYMTSNRPTFLTQHMEDVILEMTLDRFSTRAIIEELRRYYPTIKERELLYAITWTVGNK